MRTAVLDRPTETPVTPVEAPPSLTPAEELRALEQLAREKGITEQKLDEIRQIGECPDQVQTRIRRLRELAA